MWKHKPQSDSSSRSLQSCSSIKHEWQKNTHAQILISTKRLGQSHPSTSTRTARSETKVCQRFEKLDQASQRHYKTESEVLSPSPNQKFRNRFGRASITSRKYQQRTLALLGLFLESELWKESEAHIKLGRSQWKIDWFLKAARRSVEVPFHERKQIQPWRIQTVIDLWTTKHAKIKLSALNFYFAETNTWQFK